MTGGVNYNQRDIVIIPFPYSDLSGSKPRPSLVISSEHRNRKTEDLILCQISSKPIRTKYDVYLEDSDIKGEKLRKKSKVRPDKIFTLSRSKIIKKVGKLDKERSKKVIENLNQIIEIKD